MCSVVPKKGIATRKKVIVAITHKKNTKALFFKRMRPEFPYRY